MSAIRLRIKSWSAGQTTKLEECDTSLNTLQLLAAGVRHNEVLLHFYGTIDLIDLSSDSLSSHLCSSGLVSLSKLPHRHFGLCSTALAL